MQVIPIENESCPECGETPIAFNAGSDGLIFDGDSVRCPDCQLRGSASIGEGNFLLHWDDEAN